MPYYRRNPELDRHCKGIIRDCLNIVEERGDTYVAIHKDDDIECVVLVSLIRCYPMISIIVADRLLFSEVNCELMYRYANELNTESVIGWHSLMLSDDSLLYMYRQCIWLSMELEREQFFDMLCESISEYKRGRAYLTGSGS